MSPIDGEETFEMRQNASPSFSNEGIEGEGTSAYFRKKKKQIINPFIDGPETDEKQYEDPQ